MAQVQSEGVRPQTICPGSPGLPEIGGEAGRLYLAPPLQHTRDRLYVDLGQAGWAIRFYAQPVMEFAVQENGLSGLLVAIAERLSQPEQEATQALFLPHGEALQIADLAQVQPLSVWIARAGTPWLSELIREERVKIFFQPIVHAADPQRVFAYECLLRGVAEDGSIISPLSLFRAAEAADLEFHLDRLARVAAIREGHRLALEPNLFINFRPTAIYDPAFCLQTTVGAVRALDLEPQRFVFEVVESEAVTDSAHLRRIVDEYRRGGFRIALDDLGSGYASLNLLNELAPDFVKFDQELIRGVHRDESRAVIVEGLIQMAKGLGVETVAEGVEEAEEYRWLREAGVDLIQGYYFARPANPPQQVSVADVDATEPRGATSR